MATTLRKDFDDFLFASVGDDANGMPVTLLTVLARLGVDPWEEAADLAHLSREPAMQRLAARLEAGPNAPASAADTVSIATRLIALLHRAPPRNTALRDATPLPDVVKKLWRITPAMYWLIGLILFLVIQWTLSW